MVSEMKTHDIESLRSMIDSTPVSIQIVGPKGVFLDCNKATYPLFGIKTTDEIIGKPPSVFSPPYQSDGTNSEERSKKYIQQAMLGNAVSFEWDHLRASGEVFACQVNLQPITYDGQPCLMATIVDATDMRNKVAWYESILDAVQFPIHVTDMNMNWTYMNKAFEEVLLKNKVIKDRKSAYGLPCSTADATICKTAQCGIEQLRISGVTESYFEWQGMNGKQVTKPVMNAKGEQVGYVETVQDLTEQLDQVAWYESILDAVQFPIHVTDMNMNWTYMNKAFEEVLLKNKVIKDRKSAYGLPCSTADATICKTAQCGIEQLRTSGVTESYFEWQGMNGKQVTKPVMNAKGEQVGYVETVQDLTEQLDQVAWYESILDAVQFPIHVTDMNMNWTYMNKAFEEVLLKNKVIKDRKSAYGLPCYTADATICRTENCGIEQLRKKGVTESYFEWQGMNGKQVTKPVMNAKGEQVGYVETVQDLTEQLNLIAYYESILDAVPMPITVTDMDTRWTFVNKAVETMLNRKRSELVGHPCNEWGANICNTANCGISRLRSGYTNTTFEQDGGHFKVDCAYITNMKGEKIGHVEIVGDITQVTKVSAYLREEVDHLAKNLKKLAVGDIDCNYDVLPPDEYTKEVADLFVAINRDLKEANNAIALMIADSNMLSRAAVDGHLDTRANADRHQGEFRKIVEGVNKTLDAVIGPLNIAAEYVDRISKGDIPPRITDTYNGDFNEIKNNLNSCIDGLQGLVQANKSLQRMAVNDYTLPVTGSYQGVFADVASAVNLVQERINHIAESLQKISLGDLSELEDYKKIGKRSEHDMLVPGFIRTLSTLNTLVSDTKMLVEAAKTGNLETRADQTRHQGDYRIIVEGVNETLDSVIIPVKEALRVSREYSNYQFKTRVDPSLRVAGDWVEFKNALDNIGIQVSNAVGHINRQLVDLASNAEEATASIEEVSAGAQQVAHNAGSVSKNADMGTDGITQVLKAMQDLNVTVGEVSQRAEQVSSSSVQANEFSKMGIDLAKKSESSMIEVTRSSSEVDVIIKEINTQMADIGKIVRLITDIANQTNLLALNAAIEAARAGEAGRGFAVVAAEVKSLAQDSRKSAEDIADMISTLQDKAQKATTAMAYAGETVAAGSKSLGETLEAFNKIASSIADITRNAMDVAAASEEQAASVEEVTASIHEVSELLTNTTKEAEDAAAATEEASASLEQISRIVSNVSGITDSVSREMSKFVV